jgi:hypothetical protein
MAVKDAELLLLSQRLHYMLRFLLCGVDLPLNFNQETLQLGHGHVPVIVKVSVIELLELLGWSEWRPVEPAGEAEEHPI